MDHPVSERGTLPLWSILDQFKQPAGTEILIDPLLAAIDKNLVPLFSP